MHHAYSGGIAGSSEGVIDNCYSTGGTECSGHSDYGAGGISGNRGTADNCYWNINAVQITNGKDRDDSEKKGVDNGNDSTAPKTTAQMKLVGFVNLLNENRGENAEWLLDADNLNDGYPILKVR